MPVIAPPRIETRWCPVHRRFVRWPVRRMPRPRRRIPLLNAAGDRLLDTSGNRILDASGNVFLSNGTGDDCCCATGSPCANCSPGSTPSQVTVILDSIAVCTNCVAIQTSPNRWGKITVTGSINGTFTLPQTANPCIFADDFSPTMQVTEYSDSSCTTVLTTLSVESPYTVQANRNFSNAWTVTAKFAGADTAFSAICLAATCSVDSAVTNNSLAATCSNVTPDGLWFYNGTSQVLP